MAGKLGDILRDEGVDSAKTQGQTGAQSRSVTTCESGAHAHAKSRMVLPSVDGFGFSQTLGQAGVQSRLDLHVASSTCAGAQSRMGIEGPLDSSDHPHHLRPVHRYRVLAVKGGPMPLPVFNRALVLWILLMGGPMFMPALNRAWVLWVHWILRPPRTRPCSEFGLGDGLGLRPEWRNLLTTMLS